MQDLWVTWNFWIEVSLLLLKGLTRGKKNKKNLNSTSNLHNLVFLLSPLKNGDHHTSSSGEEIGKTDVECWFKWTRQRRQFYIYKENVSRTFECIIYKVPWKISKISIWNVVRGRIIPQSPSLSAPCWLICTQPERYVSNHGAEIGRKRYSSYHFLARSDGTHVVFWDQNTNTKSVSLMACPAREN